MLQLVLTAPRSGGGKTTAACALLAALAARGQRPCAFKAGPDYIDPMFHRAVLGVKSHNLDLYFSAPDTVRRLYAQGATDCDAAVCEGEAVCGGIADAYVYLLERGGIPARVITGTSRSADGTADSHAWVAAELDGAVYYFDPTWDLQDDESETALPGYLSHTWFALTAERMAVRHTADDPALWPDSRANADNYYVRSGYTAAEATVAAAAAAVRSQWDDGRAVLEFRCETPEVYAGMQSLLFERDRLWDVYRALGSYVSSSGYQCADDQQIIRLIPAR